jgi:hypothetical protein
MAPPPVRHVTAIHEPGLKEGYGDSGLGLIRNQCLAVLRHIAVRQIFFSGNHFSTFSSRLSVWRLRRQVPS